jgi:hypothetical protein
MDMRGFRNAVLDNRRLLGWGLAAAAVAWLLIYMLGSLTGGLSRGEMSAAAAPVGWHGIYEHPLYLPLKLARSVVFSIFPAHGQSLTRLPNVLFGALAIISFSILIRLWHGSRIAVLSTAMFAAGAWTLHVSRLASFDVMYLCALPVLVASHFMLRKHCKKPLVWLSGIVIWSLLLYIPGLVWFVIADIWLQRRFIAEGWRHAGQLWLRVLYVLAGLVWLPLLALGLSRSGTPRAWLGLPSHWGSAGAILKHFAAVPVHLFVRGPEYPSLWLGRAPILDVFGLAVFVLGVYFYISRWRSARSRYLFMLALMGFILVGVSGPVTLSLLVPLLYMGIATGLAYLLHEWLKIFPNNPLARGVGLGLIILAVAISCIYNYRAYFVAWPNAEATKTTFQYRRHP